MNSVSPARIETVVLDMAGTTITDDSLVEEAFLEAWDELRSDESAERRAEAIGYVRDTMGQSKIEVFRHLLPEGDAQALNVVFEAAYDRYVAEGRVLALDGAEAAIRELQAQGRKVALATGFARGTTDAILAWLGWEGLADFVITPAEAGRGRPFPDLNLTALIRTGASSVDAIAAVGDTAMDVAAGRATGAGLVIGVLTGALSREGFEAVGADQILPSVVELPELLARLGR